MEVNDDDDDDEVKEEIPVYLCKELANKLHLFQFPCKIANYPTDELNVVSSRVKPENGIIQLDIKLETDDRLYDKFSGEEFGSKTSVSEQSSKEKTEVSNKLLNTLTYQSQRNILKKDIDRYSVAVIRDKICYITPLHDAVSFLPTYEHTEKNKNIKTNKKSTSAEDSSSSETEIEENPAVPVTVKFSQRNNDKVSQEPSLQQYLTKVAEEPWHETRYFDNNSEKAAHTLKSLANTSKNDNTELLSLSQKEYFDMLIPTDSTNLF